MTVKERLVTYIKHTNLSIRAFEIKCNLANGLINNIKYSISHSTLDKISNQFSELNKNWLLTGEGSMLNKQYKNEEENHAKEPEPGKYRNMSEIVNAQQETITSQKKLIKMLTRENEQLRIQIDSFNKQK